MSYAFSVPSFRNSRRKASQFLGVLLAVISAFLFLAVVRISRIILLELRRMGSPSPAVFMLLFSNSLEIMMRFICTVQSHFVIRKDTHVK